MRFATKRLEVFYSSSKRGYLFSKASNGVSRPNICHAIAWANSQLGRNYASHGIPWPTLVLGSGCLADEDDPSSAAAVGHLPTRVALAFPAKTDLIYPNGISESDLAVRFVESLVRSRSSHTKVLTEPLAELDPVPVWDANLVLGAALLTETYYVLSRQQHRALSRLRAETIDYVLEYGDDPIVGPLLVRTSVQLNALARRALDDADVPDWVQSALSNLRNQIHTTEARFTLATSS